MRAALAAAAALYLTPWVAEAFSPSSMLSSSRTARWGVRAHQHSCMTLRPGSQSERVETSVTRRGSLLAAAGLGVTIFGLPAASHADSFEEFMRKKQSKERMERARKEGVGVGEDDDLPLPDPDDNLCSSVEECEALAKQEKLKAKNLKTRGEEDEEDDEEGQLAENEDEDEDEKVAKKTPTPSARDEYKNLKPTRDEDPFKTRLMTVLRVQESCMQEARLITTGNFKDLQRNNIKLATRMMIENNRLNDVITKASGGATDASKVSDANEVGKAAIADLQMVLDYFDEVDREVKVSDLPKDKKNFILKAFANCRDKLDRFLSYMPTDKVKAARDQVVLENELNKKELPKDLEILNPVFMN